MGLWSSIKKGFKKIVKGVKKVFKKVGGAVKKVAAEVSRFAKTGLGKAVIAAAAIYYGGAALGKWAAPGVPQGGFFASQKAATGMGGLASAEQLTSATQQPAVASTAGAQTGGLVDSAKGALSAAGKWAEDNPILTQLGGKALGAVGSQLMASDAAPMNDGRDYIAEMREKYKLEEAARQQQKAETNIAGVNYGGDGAALSGGLLAQGQAVAAPAVDPVTGLPIDPVTGLPINPNAAEVQYA